jgi:hypothetical protein
MISENQKVEPTVNTRQEITAGTVMKPKLKGGENHDL